MKTTWMICMMTLLAAALLAPGCNAVEEKNRQADNTADVVLKLLAAEKADSLYKNYTTEGFREANSEETVRKLAKALNIYLGEPESHSLLKFDLKIANGSASGQYVYKVQWAKADGTLTLNLLWQNGECKIQTLDVQSSALEGGRTPTTKPVNNGKTIHI